MATSSAFNTSNERIKYTITVTTNARNITTNSTNVTVSVRFYRTNTGYTTWGSGTVYCKIDGTTYSSPVTTSQKITEDGIVLFTKSVYIAHNTNGTKTLTCSAWIDHSQFSSTEQSYSEALTTINRISYLTASNGTLGTAQTITINRYDSSFKHKIQYACGSASGYVVGSASAFTTATSISWTPPLSLAMQNTAGTSVSIKFTLGTYTSSGTLVGYATRTITCSIPASVKPSVVLSLEDINGIDDIYGSPVQGLSRIQISVKPTAAQGSPIVSYLVTADGDTYTTAVSTTGLLEKSGSSPVVATVTDRRGRSGTVTYTMNVQAYSKPSVKNVAVHRCNEDGTENGNGSYVKATFTATVSSMSNKNTAIYLLNYKKSSATAYTTVALTPLNNVYEVNDYSVVFPADDGSSYDVQIVASDRHYSDTRTTSASTAFTLIHYGADGESLALGKVQEKPGWLENNLPTENLKTTVLKGNRYAFSSPGTANASGYVLMAQITVTAANADVPMTFVFSRRQEDAPMTVHVRLKNASGTTASVESIKYEGANYDAYLSSADNITWGLYVLKGSQWDTITLQDWWISKTMESRVNVVFPGTLVSQVPTPYYKATPAQLQSVLDYIYPVGSIYMSYSHYDPNEMFGGTWVRLELTFLYAGAEGATIGAKGGSTTHTLTVDELPSHTHGSVYSQHTSGTKGYNWYTTSGDKIGYGTVATGGGKAHNNMPPYTIVSMWRRTA